jgi:hypothetical protein
VEYPGTAEGWARFSSAIKKLGKRLKIENRLVYICSARRTGRPETIGSATSLAGILHRGHKLRLSRQAGSAQLFTQGHKSRLSSKLLNSANLFSIMITHNVNFFLVNKHLPISSQPSAIHRRAVVARYPWFDR